MKTHSRIFFLNILMLSALRTTANGFVVHYTGQEDGEDLFFPESMKSMQQEVQLISKSGNVVNPLDSVPPVLIEVAIVCDKDFGADYQHNRQKIVDFWTSYFWDITARFGTLVSVSVKFSVTSITVIKDLKEQPFIESTRNNITGEVSHDRIMPLFQKWMYKQLNELPTFDIAILATRANMAWRGGQAYYRGACKIDRDDERFLGCLVMDGNLGSGSHEIAHLLGTLHDDNDSHCSSHKAKYIMHKELHLAAHTFSSCSDESIHKFVASNHSWCLRESEMNPTGSILDPYFDTVLPPTISEQCEQLSSYSKARATQLDKTNPCGLWSCKTGPTKATLFSPMSNTKCGDGKRCFLGRCVLTGFKLVNVGSGKCLSLLRSGPEAVQTVPCPVASTPRDRFILDGDVDQGMLLSTAAPHLILMDKYETICAKVEIHVDNELEIVTYDLCKKLEINDLGARWVIIEAENEEFLLMHRMTGKCAVYFRETIWVDPKCNQTDPLFRWKFELVLPAPDMCPDEDKCETDLRVETLSYVDNKATQVLVVEITLVCAAGVAIEPAAIISWSSNKTLISMPRNCFPLKRSVSITEIKCKLGRLLTENETAQVALLNFDLAKLNIGKSEHNLAVAKLLGLQVTPTTASKIVDIDAIRNYTTQVLVIVLITVIVALMLGLMMCLYMTYYHAGVSTENYTCRFFGQHQATSSQVSGDTDGNKGEAEVPINPEEIPLTQES